MFPSGFGAMPSGTLAVSSVTIPTMPPVALSYSITWLFFELLTNNEFPSRENARNEGPSRTLSSFAWTNTPSNVPSRFHVKISSESKLAAYNLSSGPIVISWTFARDLELDESTSLPRGSPFCCRKISCSKDCITSSSSLYTVDSIWETLTNACLVISSFSLEETYNSLESGDTANPTGYEISCPPCANISTELLSVKLISKTLSFP